MEVEAVGLVEGEGTAVKVLKVDNSELVERGSCLHFVGLVVQDIPTRSASQSNGLSKHFSFSNTVMRH